MDYLEILVFRGLNSFVGTDNFFDWGILFSAQYLLYAMIAAVFLFYSFDKNEIRVRLAIIHSFFAGVLARLVFDEIIYLFYNRARPFEILEGVKLLIFRDGGGSFPSGHASFSFALAMGIYYYYPKTGILFFLGALAMGAGRVSAGVHWPSDILGGIIVGVLSAMLLEFLLKKLQYK